MRLILFFDKNHHQLCDYCSCKCVKVNVCSTTTHWRMFNWSNTFLSSSANYPQFCSVFERLTPPHWLACKRPGNAAHIVVCLSSQCSTKIEVSCSSFSMALFLLCEGGSNFFVTNFLFLYLWQVPALCLHVILRSSTFTPTFEATHSFFAAILAHQTKLKLAWLLSVAGLTLLALRREDCFSQLHMPTCKLAAQC